MLSPTNATVLTEVGTHASSVLMKYLRVRQYSTIHSSRWYAHQCATLCVFASEMFAAVTWLPNVMKDVVLLPG